MDTVRGFPATIKANTYTVKPCIVRFRMYSMRTLVSNKPQVISLRYTVPVPTR